MKAVPDIFHEMSNSPRKGGRGESPELGCPRCEKGEGFLFVALRVPRVYLSSAILASFLGFT